MGRISIAVEETDRHGLDTLCPKELGSGKHGLFGQGTDNGTVGRHPLIGLQAQATADQGLRFVPVKVEHVGGPDTPDLQDVPKSPCRQKAGDGAGPLQYAVRAYGGAVDHRVHHAGMQVVFGQDLDQPLDHRSRRILGRRGDLLQVETTVPTADNDIGERAADIDTDLKASLCGIGETGHHPPTGRKLSPSMQPAEWRRQSSLGFICRLQKSPVSITG